VTPTFLTVATVEALHALSIEVFGGSGGLRDRRLLESAVAQPRTGFGDQYAYGFPAGMASAYVFGLVRNHPFVDGNKRVAAAALGVFVEQNGCSLQIEDDDLVACILAVATGQMTRSELELFLATVIR